MGEGLDCDPSLLTAVCKILITNNLGGGSAMIDTFTIGCSKENPEVHTKHEFSLYLGDKM